MKTLLQPPHESLLAVVLAFAVCESAALLCFVVWQAYILEHQRAVIRNLACQIYRCT